MPNAYVVKSSESLSDFSHFVLAKAFRASCGDPVRSFDKNLTDLGIFGGRGNIAERAKHPQADRDIGLRIHADLFEGRIQQSIERDPWHIETQHAWRIVDS